MKLLNKTSLIILTVTLFIFFLGGIAFYRIIQNMIISSVDNDLMNQQRNITEEIRSMSGLENAYPITRGKVIIKKSDTDTPLHHSFKDTILYDEGKKVYLPYRVLEFGLQAGESNYSISVSRSMLEAENLIEQIVLTMMLMMLTFVLALFFLNRYLFRRIWEGFFITVGKVKSFNLHDDPVLNLPYSEVEEFQILNQVFEKLTQRIHTDYLSLKEFTENASHEIQTPLSIMHSKIELLLQYPGYTDEQIAQISQLSEAVSRLSNINKVLILLTRIENDQFPDRSEVNLRERIEYHLENFKEVIEAKNINVSCNYNDEVIINVNSALADILLINLIKNAIRHSFDNAEISILLTGDALQISNSGPVHNVPPEELFNRFVRGRQKEDSLGLGLSLVKKICELYRFEVNYISRDKLHIVKVIFNPAPPGS